MFFEIKINGRQIKIIKKICPYDVLKVLVRRPRSAELAKFFNLTPNNRPVSNSENCKKCYSLHPNMEED